MTALEKAAPPARIITIEFDGEDIDDAERAFDAIEVLLGDMGQIGTLHMGPEIPSIPASALLDPSDEVVEATSIVLAGTDQDGWDRLCCESPSLAKRISDKSRALLRAAGVKITGRTE